MSAEQARDVTAILATFSGTTRSIETCAHCRGQCGIVATADRYNWLIYVVPTERTETAYRAVRTLRMQGITVEILIQSLNPSENPHLLTGLVKRNKDLAQNLRRFTHGGDVS